MKITPVDKDLTQLSQGNEFKSHRRYGDIVGGWSIKHFSNLKAFRDIGKPPKYD